MIKVMIIVSLYIFSQPSMGYYCGVSFLKTPHKKLFSRVNNIDKRSLNKMHKQMQETKDISEKLDLLEDQYDVLKKAYRDQKTLMTSDITKNIDSKLFDAETGAKLLAEMNSNLTHEISLHSNKLIKEAKLVFESSGIDVLLKKRVYDGKRKYSYLELSETHTKFMSPNKIARYKDRFGTQTVTFDLVENIKKSLAGFSEQVTRRVDLGVTGMKAILVDDLVTMVGKHEFQHAAFAAKRVKNQESIYHVSYYSNNLPLSEAKASYDMYMTAEEVYNFANNSFWASDRIGKISSYAKKDFFGDINQIHRLLPTTEKIAKQTVEITDNFIRHVDDIRLSMKTGASDFIPVFYNNKLQVARSFDEAMFFGIQIEKKGHVAFEFISPKYKKMVKEIFDNRIKIENKFTQNNIDLDFSSISPEKQQQIRSKLSAEESILSKNVVDDLLVEFSDSQSSLGQVSKSLVEDSKLAFEATEEFITKVKSQLETNPDFLKTESAEIIFLEMRKMYRKLGNTVKENYKGFAGR